MQITGAPIFYNNIFVDFLCKINGEDTLISVRTAHAKSLKLPIFSREHRGYVLTEYILDLASLSEGNFLHVNTTTPYDNPAVTTKSIRERYSKETYFPQWNDTYPIEETNDISGIAGGLLLNLAPTRTGKTVTLASHEIMNYYHMKLLNSFTDSHFISTSEVAEYVEKDYIFLASQDGYAKLKIDDLAKDAYNNRYYTTFNKGLRTAKMQHVRVVALTDSTQRDKDGILVGDLQALAFQNGPFYAWGFQEGREEKPTRIHKRPN